MESTERLPNIHPGEILREDWLVPMGKSVYWLAKGLGMQQTAVAQILNGERAITALTAHRLSRFLGCGAEFWMGLQAQYDLEDAWLKNREQLEQIMPHDGGEPKPYPRHIPVIEDAADLAEVKARLRAEEEAEVARMLETRRAG